MRAHALKTLNKCPGAQASTGDAGVSPAVEMSGCVPTPGAKSQNTQNTQNIQNTQNTQNTLNTPITPIERYETKH